MLKDRSKLTTEKRNVRSRGIDRHSSLRIVDIINAEDRKVAEAVRRERRALAEAVDIVAERLGQGGRLFYVGAGTSGRLGVLDAAECPPTYGTPRTMVQGILAGGRRALVRSIDGAEDRAADGAAAVRRRRIGKRDVVVGIAACGLTPFVRGAIAAARKAGAATVFVTCAPEAVEFIGASLVINPVVGPEVVTGSTRMKAGTATKLVLNTITTGAMIRLGKVHDNLMVDLRATNAKLRDRAERIVMEVTGVTRPQARALLKKARGWAKVAILMHFRKVDFGGARKLLAACGQSLRKAIESQPR
ncbi:MAG: N-acetylmuramic acid 6-phosphate etherase [Planctomycetota bacterium]|nr:N-acetylmuramic acid 6-phosphate etherase [Planctomycetota bacterium]